MGKKYVYGEDASHFNVEFWVGETGMLVGNSMTWVYECKQKRNKCTCGRKSKSRMKERDAEEDNTRMISGKDWLRCERLYGGSAMRKVC